MDNSDFKNIFDLINSILPELTKSERKVAQLVLDEREKLTNMTIMDISQVAHVSEASVMRFCNKIGFKRLIDFKIQIAKDATSSYKTTLGSTSQEDEFVELVKNTASLVNDEKINRVVDLIENSEQLYFYGIASSGISARIGEDCFQRMGLRTSVVTEEHFQMLKAANMTERDMIIALSLSGNTRDLCDACQLAKDNHATVVAITSYPNSKLAKMADIVLLTSAEENLVDGGKITGSVSQLYVLDALKRGYEHRHLDAVARLKSLIGETIITKKY